MADTVLIRCPVCLRSQSVKSDYPAGKSVYCGNCGRDFMFKNALPVAGDRKTGDISSATSPATSAVAEPGGTIQAQEVRSRNPVVTWAVGLIFMLVALRIARPFMATLRGPEFLFFYGFVLVASLLAVGWLRKVWEDGLHVTILGLILYEAVGVLRYLDGTAAGMHKFTIMFAMMGIGGLMMFMRSDNFSGDSSSSSCSGFGGCGSSCSGCGGGGGCGGCGD